MADTKYEWSRRYEYIAMLFDIGTYSGHRTAPSALVLCSEFTLSHVYRFPRGPVVGALWTLSLNMCVIC